MPTIPRNTAIRVWTGAGGRCSFDDCPNDLFDITPDKLLGHLAHIVARKYDGPRGDPHYPESKLNSPENLMLFCAHHHQMVDSDVPAFTVEGLRKTKSQHEQRVADVLRMARPWKEAWNLIYYLNIPRLAMFSAVCGVSLSAPISRGFKYLHELGYELGVLLHHFKAALHRIEFSAIPLESIDRMTDAHVGAYFSFCSSCWTKNIPSYNDLKEGWSLSGDLMNDPHIHFRHRDTKIVLAIDPRWLTTSTSFHDLMNRGKTSRIAGLMQLKRIDQGSALASFTPLVFGLRLTPAAAALDNGTLFEYLMKEANRKKRRKSHGNE